MGNVDATDQDPEAEQAEDQTGPKTALTIVIHSWATPIVGALMLMIGLQGGYFGRPLLAQQSSAGAVSPQAGASSPVAATVAAQDRTTNSAELMAFVVGQTRHFKGDPNAPVTLIEFSDFQ
jgi:hypothetical protein